MIHQEIWKEIPFAKNYEISSYGNMRRHINKNHPERKQIKFLKNEIARNGYSRLYIKRQHYLAHRLVYLMFVGPLEDGMVICHIDGDKQNNHFSNLLQATQKQNIHHKKDHGTWQSGEKHPFAKLTNLQAITIKRLLANAERNKQGRLVHGKAKMIADEVGVETKSVYSISRKRSAYYDV